MKKGFTLIELLIVVAIIAILAAIAVPNFLEAQVRSKVSRAKTDMRTLATAIEAYSVENNKYPFTQETDEQGKYPLYMEQRFRRLTTPIAYITSMPFDPFMNGRPGDPLKDAAGKGLGPSGQMRFTTYDFLTKDSLYTGFWFGTDRAAADAWWNGLIGPMNGIFDPVELATYTTSKKWYLSSLGPDRWPNSAGTASHQFGQTYDATNGTVSDGDIHRMGP